MIITLPIMILVETGNKENSDNKFNELNKNVFLFAKQLSNQNNLIEFSKIKSDLSKFFIWPWAYCIKLLLTVISAPMHTYLFFFNSNSKNCDGRTTKNVSYPNFF